MTADIELLPLPERSQLANPYLSKGALTYGHDDNSMKTYARANVAHATAAKDAELVELRSTIEALRAEVERWEVPFLEWLDKTEWVQQTVKPRELGHHRADIMRLRLEQSEARAERLAEALRGMREYVTAALQDQHEAFAGHEDSSDIPGIEADLHKIDTLLREQENDDA